MVFIEHFPDDRVRTDPKSNAADGTVTFDAIKYTLADVAKSPIQYTINEVVPEGSAALGGVTYDKHVETITVTLADKKDGTITATADKTGTAVKFGNTYDAEGDLTLEGSKSITGREFKDSDSATFKIEAAGKAPLPEATEVTIRPASGDNDTFTLGPIEFKLSDLGGEESKTFEYRVTESAASMDGVTKDDNVINVKVTVTDNGDGTLTADLTEDSEAIEFTNTYYAEGDAVLSAYKELTGRKLKAGEFSFELKDADGNVLQTKSNAADGTVTFDAIKYTLADVANSPITYTISEVIPDDAELKDGKYVKNNVTYDDHEETITVTLIDNKDGTITATPDKEGTSVKFTNTYKPNKTVKTGDDTNMFTPIATFATSLSMFILSLFGFRRNRRKEDEEE